MYHFPRFKQRLGVIPVNLTGHRRPFVQRNESQESSRQSMPLTLARDNHRLRPTASCEIYNVKPRRPSSSNIRSISALNCSCRTFNGPSTYHSMADFFSQRVFFLTSTDVYCLILPSLKPQSYTKEIFTVKKLTFTMSKWIGIIRTKLERT
jgi:hypothetical protein